MTTQINSTSELQAINTMLSFIGESPVSSITGNIGTDVAVAKNILDETSMSVQSQGWFFNREFEITVSRDTSNKVGFGKQPCIDRPHCTCANNGDAWHIHVFRP